MCPSRALDSLLIEPHSKFRLYWDGVSCVLIAFIALALPYRSAFAVDWSLLWTLIDFFIDVFFIVDIFINLRTMYHGLDGQLVMNTRLIFLRCTRTHVIQPRSTTPCTCACTCTCAEPHSWRGP
jgi:hypothetical protein